MVATVHLSSELGEWLENKGIKHIRGRAHHPMTQGKIERHHRSMKKSDPAGSIADALTSVVLHFD